MTVGVVTKPFTFEGKPRMNNAVAGVARLQDQVDTMIVIPNDKLLQICEKKTTIPDALKKADEVLQQGVQGITDMIYNPGLINVDFADIQTVMRDKGIAHIGMGVADEELEAIKAAMESPLLETTVSGATDIIVNFSGDVGMLEAQQAVEYLKDTAGQEVNVIFGTVNSDMGDQISATIVATVFSLRQEPEEQDLRRKALLLLPFFPDSLSTAVSRKVSLLKQQNLHMGAKNRRLPV